MFVVAALNLLQCFWHYISSIIFTFGSLQTNTEISMQILMNIIKGFLVSNMLKVVHQIK